MKWIDTSVGEYCPFQYGKGLPKSKRVNGDFPVYGSNGQVDSHNETYINSPGIVIGRKGSVGAVHLSRRPFWPIDTSFYVTKDSINELKFAYYLLSSIGLEHMNSDSAVPGLNRENAHSVSIRIPENKTDRELLGQYLDQFDRKIAINNKINQTLEQISQAIFKSWFVDFEPTKAKIAAREALLAENPAATSEQITTAEQQAAIQAIAGAGDIIPTEQLQTIPDMFPNHLADSELGKIPEGWEVGCLADLIEFNPKRTLKKGTESPYLDMKNVPVSGHLAEDVVLKEMKSGTKFINGDTLLARITPCLENGKTAYVDFLDEEQVGWGSTEFIVMRPKRNIHTSIAYLIARQETFRSIAIQTMTGTSGRQRADAKALATKKWVIYPNTLLAKFSQISSSFMALGKINGDQNKSLSLMRDTLLPKLLSGEITYAKNGGNYE